MNPLTQFKKIRILPLLIVGVLVALASATIARANTITDWNLIASNAIVLTAGQPPPASALSFAMVQGAVYDAVNAIDRSYQPYLPEPPSNPTDSKEAAAATAAYRVLVGFVNLPGLFPSTCSSTRRGPTRTHSSSTSRRGASSCCPARRSRCRSTSVSRSPRVTR